METSFHPSLTLVPSLANYSISLYTPPSLGSPSFTTPFPSFHGMHMTLGQKGGSIKCSGKYIEVHFSFKITFPLIRLPEHLISTISIIDPDGGTCNSKGVEAEGMQTQDSNKLPIGVRCQSQYHRRSTVNWQGMCQSQEGQN